MPSRQNVHAKLNHAASYVLFDGRLRGLFIAEQCSLAVKGIGMPVLAIKPHSFSYRAALLQSF
ncbi:hypothetical protein [Bradyrhizobium sp. AUGA SZCCT0182]|uniref:hypothetical protein n=1 Tax=Bradyrhizobium sp. AUGA SZCCT0182 TaxID=2807667 RepID=UPI001BA9A610|nr:hypothetical protein [Bradyrhizobium sp. AUGA SZCCT0182]MBR1236651.1 hypothetical protein [Bradyrhizobium sp. AUGA SZCCT0182]